MSIAHSHQKIGSSTHPYLRDAEDGIAPDFPHLPRNILPKELILDDPMGKSARAYNPSISPEDTFIDVALQLITESDDNPYYVDNGHLKLRGSATCILDALRSVCNNRHQWTDVYTPNVNLFLDAFDKNFHESFWPFNENEIHEKLDHHGALVKRPLCKWVNDFCEYVRERARSKKFKRSVKNWFGDFHRRMESSNACVDNCFEVSETLSVLRLDFYQQRISYDDLSERALLPPNTPKSQLDLLLKQIDRFLNNRRHKQLFRYLINYILKIEYGPDRGYHIHLIMFFDGKHVEDDSHLSKEIGDYWVDVITAGKGSYWDGNLNLNKKRHRLLGIGRIEKADLVKRKILMDRVIAYLAKSDLKLRSKACVGQKLFRTGRLHRKLP